MAIHRSSAPKKAAKKKKTKFSSCNGCFGMFPVTVLIAAPPNQYNLRVVCQSCLKQYISPQSPVPVNSSPALKNKYGSYIGTNGAGTANNNAGLISNQQVALIGNDSAGLIGNDSAGLVGNDGASLVGNDGASLIGNDGSTFRRS